MNKINSMRKITVTNAISDYLGLRHSAKELFEYIESLPESEIYVDFTNTVFISRSFAHEYLRQKRISKKHVKTINVPKKIDKMFSVVKSSKKDSDRLNINNIKAISI